MAMDQKNILLVEDSSDDEKLIMYVLKKNNMGHEVLVVHDGVEALDYLFGTGKYADRDIRIMPKVIFLDLKLPKINGIEVLRRLRADERTKFLPVVIFTSSNEEQDIIDSYRLRANSYIRKPVDFTQFVEIVQHMGRYWLSMNQSMPKER